MQLSIYIEYKKAIEFEGETLIELLDFLTEKYGNKIKERILEDENTIKPYINIFIGNNNIETLSGVHTIISDGDIISLILPRAGG
jgi:molybdopterin converting factor small subunit